MSCALTQGLNLDCRDSRGGLKEVYIIEVGNISSMTEASGVLTAIVNATGKRFWKYQLVQATSAADETLTGNEQNGTIFYAQKIDLVINKRQVAVRNEIHLLAKNRVLIVAVDNIGQAWLFGRINGLQLNAGTAPTGTAWGDRNGYTLSFTGNEAEMAPLVQASLISALETPGA